MPNFTEGTSRRLAKSSKTLDIPEYSPDLGSNECLPKSIFPGAICEYIAPERINYPMPEPILLRATRGRVMVKEIGLVKILSETHSPFQDGVETKVTYKIVKVSK